MRKFNLKYLIVIIVIISLLLIPSKFNKNNIVTFFGFAENKETEISMEASVEIVKIHVTTGQEVKKGDVLLEVLFSDLPMEISEVTYKIEELQTKYLFWKSDLDWKITQYKIELNEKTSKIESEINIYKAQLDRNKKLANNIKSILVTKDNKNIQHPLILKINSLENELQFVKKIILTEIDNLKSQRFETNNPLITKIKNYESEISYIKSKKEKQTIVASSDGLIGNINCRENEISPSFNTLMTIYEGSPKSVVGYIHEDLLLKIKINDSIDVFSSSRAEINTTGVVKTLGSRIVEIPERLRKFKTFRTFGREVIIEIPSNNKFLQKEKVILNTFN